MYAVVIIDYEQQRTEVYYTYNIDDTYLQEICENLNITPFEVLIFTNDLDHPTVIYRPELEKE